MQLPPTVPQLRAAFADAQAILLTGPMDPDGDSIGASLALVRGINAVSDARVDVAGHANYRYDWLPGADGMLADDQVEANYDLVVVLDGDRTRLTPPVNKAFESARVKCIVDHHRSTSPEGYDVVVLDPDSASTCEMVHAMLERWGVGLDRDLATLIYTGIIFDTGGFRHSNTQPRTHRLAAELLEHGVDPSVISSRVLTERTPAGLRLLGDVLARAQFHGEGRVALSSVPHDVATGFGIADGDLEGIIDALLNTTGVECAALAVEREGGGTKLSLRSRQHVDVSKVARGLHPGGGGHVRAAGVSLAEPLTAVLARLPEVLCSAVTAAT